jgi:hypothetical protein
MSILILIIIHNKKGGLKFLSIPSKELLPENIPPTIQNLLIPPASLLDDLEFHVISPPLLA